MKYYRLSQLVIPVFLVIISPILHSVSPTPTTTDTNTAIDVPPPSSSITNTTILVTTIANNEPTTTIKTKNVSDTTTTTTTTLPNISIKLALESPINVVESMRVHTASSSELPQVETTTTTPKQTNNNVKLQYLTPVTTKSKPPMATTTSNLSLITTMPPTTKQTMANVATANATATADANTTTTSTTTGSASTTKTSPPPTTTTTNETTADQLLCSFNNHTYKIGETFFDECVSKCKCVVSSDNTKAIIAFEPRCPTYIDIMPDNCRLERSQEDICCLEKVCDGAAAAASASADSSIVVDPTTLIEATMKQQQQQTSTTTTKLSSSPTTLATAAAYTSTTTEVSVQDNVRQAKQQTTNDDDLQIPPITVTDIRLRPTLKSIDHSPIRPLPETTPSSTLATSNSNSNNDDDSPSSSIASKTTTTTTKESELSMEQQQQSTTANAGGRLAKKISPSNSYLYPTTNMPPSMMINKQSSKFVPSQTITTTQKPIPTTMAVTSTTTSTPLATTSKLLPVTTSYSAKAQQSNMAATISATQSTTPAAPVPPKNPVSIESQPQQPASMIQKSSSTTIMVPIGGNDDAVVNDNSVDPLEEDLCIVDLNTVYRINQEVSIPRCDKAICRCRYSQPDMTTEQVTSMMNKNITTTKLSTVNMARSGRKTEIACDIGCATIPESKLIPTTECPRPRKIDPNNGCECPYIGCDDNLPLFDVPGGIVDQKQQQQQQPHNNNQQEHQNFNVNDVLASGKCLLRGHQLSVNQTFDDECHSRCKCNEQLQVICEPITCTSHLPPPSEECQNWAYDTDFKPEAPNCCPPLICKDDAEDGSCSMLGATIKNLQPVPEVIVGCNMRCVCINGRVTCESTCPPIGDIPPVDLECPTGARPIQDLKTGCSCPSWVCPIEEVLALQNVTIVALNATTVRVRFTLPFAAVNQHGHAQLHYTMDPEQDDNSWTIQAFGRPGRLFDVPMIEYPLTKFKPETTYYFKIRVILDDTNSYPDPMDSTIIKVHMPAASNYFNQPKRPSSFFPTRPPSPSMTSDPRASSTTNADTTTASTTTIASTTTSSTTTTASPPKVLKYDFELTSKALGHNAVLVRWRPLTSEEKPYVDSYQIKYWSGSSDGRDAKMSQLLHKETDQTIIYDLLPNISYSMQLIVNQSPVAPVIVEAFGATAIVETLEDEQQKLLSNMKQAHLNKIIQLEKRLEEQKEIAKKELQLQQQLNSRTLTTTPTMTTINYSHETDHAMAQIDSNDVISENSKVIINLTNKWSSLLKNQTIDVFKIYYRELGPIKNNALGGVSNQHVHHVYVEPTQDGRLILENLDSDKEYKIWFDVFLRNGQKFNSTSSLIARTGTSSPTEIVSSELRQWTSIDLPPLLTAQRYAWYTLLTFTGIMTLSFVVVLYFLLKKSSSAIAPISSQSAYDNPSFTKLVSYYEPPSGPDPNNNNIDSSIKPITPTNQIKCKNGTSNNNNNHPYNTGWEYQRAEGRLI